MMHPYLTTIIYFIPLNSHFFQNLEPPMQVKHLNLTLLNSCNSLIKLIIYKREENFYYRLLEVGGMENVQQFFDFSSALLLAYSHKEKENR
uniref:Putative ovule protein n=1 Tax=Solanum chacoense TaxID=4108 RepID=A0A0V0GSJ3_SOLCH